MTEEISYLQVGNIEGQRAWEQTITNPPFTIRKKTLTESMLRSELSIRENKKNNIEAKITEITNDSNEEDKEQKISGLSVELAKTIAQIDQIIELLGE